MEHLLVERLVANGILGIAVAVLALVVRELYTSARRKAEEYEAAIARLRAEQDAQRREWEERYVTKAETWQSKYHELTAGIREVLSSLERRHRR